MAFVLDERLANDTVVVAKIDVFNVLLSKDKRFKWLIVVPEIADLSELHQLSSEQQSKFLTVSNFISNILTVVYQPHKLNIACLGNIVKQLHIHHVARFEYDDAWPGPIWGVGTAQPYSQIELTQEVERLREAIKTNNEGELDVNYDNK